MPRQTVSSSAADSVVVQLVNLTDRIVHLKDGRSWPITNFFGPDGDEIPDHDGAMSFVAGVDGQGWIAEPMAAYVDVRLN